MTIPVPDLALLVLADFRDGSDWHKGNWMNSARQEHREHFAHAGVGNRLWEAWAWLDAHAFVARRVDQDASDSRRITEDGERALSWGLARLHAAARLEVELRDELGKARRQFLAGDYEEAVFAAFRLVEEKVRASSGADSGDLGVAAHAFGVPSRRRTVDRSRRRAWRTRGNRLPLRGRNRHVQEPDQSSNCELRRPYPGGRSRAPRRPPSPIVGRPRPVAGIRGMTLDTHRVRPKGCALGRCGTRGCGLRDDCLTRHRRVGGRGQCALPMSPMASSTSRPHRARLHR